MMRKLPFRQVAHFSQRSPQIPCEGTIKDRSNAWTSFKTKDTDALAGPLRGLGIGIKANLCTTDFPTDCSSRMLKGVVLPYDATAVHKLRAKGATILGKTNMDEFGMGSSSTHSHFGPVRNPVYDDEDRVAGGSSGGSAAAVASGSCFAALGSDTGGSVRLPAAYCQVVGFKPSYGAISRHGLVSYASSLDTVGILARKVEDIELLLQIMKGKDINDPTSWDLEEDAFSVHKKLNEGETIRIGVPQEYFCTGLSDQVLEAWNDALFHLESQGIEIVPVSLPHTHYALPAYYTIAPAEASSNLAKYDGIRYGFTGTSLSNTRTEGFGEEVKKRILLGTFVLQSNEYNSYYLQAQRIRRLIVQDFDKALLTHNESAETCQNKVHALLTPVSPKARPPLLHESQAQAQKTDDYVNDLMTVPASLAGLPCVVVPFGKSKIGLQLMTGFGRDFLALRLLPFLQYKNI